MKDISRRTNLMPGAVPLAQMFQKSASLKKRPNALLNSSNPDEAIHELLVMLLQKIPMMRSDEETTSIAAFLSTLPSIANNRHQISDGDLTYLANNCRLLEAKEMDIICKVGDPPAYVYYIIEGQITVTSLKMPKYDPEALAANTLSVMGAKTPFGEVSVLSNSARTATCVCSKPAKLMLIHGKAYFQIFSNSLVKERQQKVSVFVNNPLFSSWPLPNLMAFYESLSRQTSKRLYGDVIVKQGQRTDKIYIIASGAVEICIPSLFLGADKPKDNQLTSKRSGVEVDMEKAVRTNTAISPVLVLTEGAFFGLENNPEQDPNRTPESETLPLLYTIKVCSGVCELYQMSFNQLMMNCPDKLRKKAVLRELSRRSKFLQDKINLDELIIQNQHLKSVQQMQEMIQKAKESYMDPNMLEAQRREDKAAANLLQTRRVPALQVSKASLTKLKSEIDTNEEISKTGSSTKPAAEGSQLSHLFRFVSKKKDTFESEVRQRNARLLGGFGGASCSVLSSRTQGSGERSRNKELSARDFLIRCSYRPQEFRKLGQVVKANAPLSVYAEEEDTILETRRYLNSSIGDSSFSEVKASSDFQSGSNLMVTALPDHSTFEERDKGIMKELISSKLLEEERGPVAARLVKLVEQRKQMKKNKIVKGVSPAILVDKKHPQIGLSLSNLVEVKGNLFLPKLKRQETAASSTFDVTEYAVATGNGTKISPFERGALEYSSKDNIATDTDLVSFSAR